jgi:prephenate dehydrogenase
VPIRQITIIGTGLIGGSLGLALRKKGFQGKIIGSDQPDVLRLAKKIKAIDHGVSDPIKACQGSNVVVLATPVGTIIDLIERLAPHVPADALVTDVGSTKCDVLKKLLEAALPIDFWLVIPWPEKKIQESNLPMQICFAVLSGF